MANDFVMFIDSDSDLDLEFCKEYGLRMISMPYIIDDKETYPYKDYEVFEPQPFYDMLRKGVIPTTCGLSPATYKEYFEPVLAEGKDVFYPHFSSAMSGTFSAMAIALAELREKYPDRRIVTFDTKGITVLSCAIIIELAKQYKAGKSIDEMLDWGNSEVDHFATYFFADDLKFFAKSGRVSGMAGFVGNMIGLRPIIHISQEGKMESCDKAIGRMAAVNKILAYVDKMQSNIRDYTVVVAHTDAPMLASRLASELHKKYGKELEIVIKVVNPTIGSHCGPNAAGVAFHAKSR